jgi:hypothetical protein
MTIRIASGVIFSSLAIGTTIGCSTQPVAPSGTSSTALDPPAAQTVSAQRFGDRVPGVIYVTSQGLYYDTFATADPLPMRGRFQTLVNGQTEFGPGQPGYLGGRWWVDGNANGIQDPADHFFLCPLLPPGRPTP